MGNGLKYRVPKFQRDYSWDQEQWNELILDIQNVLQDAPGLSASPSQTKNPSPAPHEPPPIHYMGYLVLKSSDNKTFDIIDGQQRLITISLFILAGIGHLKKLEEEGFQPEDNKNRRETLLNSFIGFKDPVSLAVQNKLTLNANNERFFREYLSQMKAPPVSGIKFSEKLMSRALSFFDKTLNEQFQETLENGAAIARLIENTADRLFFTSITVGDETSAYTVFETLNARGVQLSTPDLVKNYTFSLMDRGDDISEGDLKQLEDRWSAVTDSLGKNKFSDFIRADWLSKHPDSRKRNLFKQIKEGVANKDQADAYLDRLRTNAEIYSALQDSENPFWKAVKEGLYSHPQLKRSLKTLNLFRIKTPHGALIAGFRKLPPKDFIKILAYTEALLIRYDVIGNRRIDSLKKGYDTLTKAIISGQNLNSLKNILKEIQPDDAAFKRDFMERDFSDMSDKKLRWLLERIESHLNKEAIDGSLLTLEHILPKNPAEGSQWLDEFEDERAIEKQSRRIGNMTLLSPADNRSAGQQAFFEKQKIYKKSPIQITKQIERYPRWGADSISQRQKEMAKTAVEIWRIP